MRGPGCEPEQRAAPKEHARGPGCLGTGVDVDPLICKQNRASVSFPDQRIKTSSDLVGLRLGTFRRPCAFDGIRESGLDEFSKCGVRVGNISSKRICLTSRDGKVRFDSEGPALDGNLARLCLVTKRSGGGLPFQVGALKLNRSENRTDQKTIGAESERECETWIQTSGRVMKAEGSTESYRCFLSRPRFRRLLGGRPKSGWSTGCSVAGHLRRCTSAWF